LETQEKPGTQTSIAHADARQHPRFKLETGIRVYSRSAGLLTGHTVDISESGISALLKLDLPVGEVVELVVELPDDPIEIRALVRHKTAFRYGFQFVEPELQSVISTICSRLAAQKRRE